MTFIEQTVRECLVDTEDSTFLESVKGCILQEIACSKTESNFCVRLIFQPDHLNKYTITIRYKQMPEGLNTVFCAIGLHVESISKQQTDGSQLITINFVEGLSLTL